METFIKSNKWFLAAFVLFSIFVFLTPINLYHAMGVFLALIEGVLCAGFVFMGLVQVNSFNDLLFLNSEDYPKLNDSGTIVIPVVVIILGAICFSMSTSGRTNALIKEKGVSALATITSGFQKTTKSIRRGSQSSYYVQLSFTLTNGKVYNTSSDVSSEVYQSVSLGQAVEIKYLPENPSIFKIMVGNENIREFIGVTNRNLAFEDLGKIIELPIDSVENYLNSISVKWDLQKDENGYVFVNESKREVVARGFNGNLLYKGPDITGIDHFMRKADVLEQESETIKDDPEFIAKTIKTFITSKYIIQHTFGISKQGKGGTLFLTMRPKD
jgi:hypothetical protein